MDKMLFTDSYQVPTSRLQVQLIYGYPFTRDALVEVTLVLSKGAITIMPVFKVGSTATRESHVTVTNSGVPQAIRGLILLKIGAFYSRPSSGVSQAI
jgi:hypothetical protein